MESELYESLLNVPVLAFWLAPLALALYLGIWSGCTRLAFHLRERR